MPAPVLNNPSPALAPSPAVVRDRAAGVIGEPVSNALYWAYLLVPVVSMAVLGGVTIDVVLDHDAVQQFAKAVVALWK
ncbi:MAG: hypothetical protein B7733_05960 [Myxococcales bacterium FL481]|nr:MAG: hypothetical protein B7733_05960 [Myxococcales bacterium FL481]